MAGHSKWHNIKHRKAAQDAKKSKVYAKVAKVIQMAAKNGADPMLNPVLDAALTKARQTGLPKDVIQKAIDKGAGNVEGEELVEIYYEGYGPAGVALYIKCVTSNTNRSGSSIRALLTKMGGSLGEPGSVARQFKEKGEIFVSGKLQTTNSKGKEITEVLPLDEDEFEMVLMESSADDYEIEDGIARVLTSREDFISTVHFFEKNGRNIEQSDLQFLAENEISLEPEREEKLQRLIDMLEEDEDVDMVFHNAA